MRFVEEERMVDFALSIHCRRFGVATIHGKVAGESF
jgi:hypothetical protein